MTSADEFTRADYHFQRAIRTNVRRGPIYGPDKPPPFAGLRLAIVAAALLWTAIITAILSFGGKS